MSNTRSRPKAAAGASAEKRSASKRAGEDAKFRVEGVGLFADKPLFTLALLREAKKLTQVKVAEASGIAQGDVSKLERKEALDDVQVSMIRRYAAALGAEVQIVVVLDGARYVLRG